MHVELRCFRNFNPACAKVFYNCALENLAYEIAKSCERGIQFAYHHAGSNIAFFDNQYYLDDPDLAVYDAIDRWWNRGERYDAPENLMPSVNDEWRAPFFQMANGATTKFGCAFHTCNNSSRPPFVSFVCTYGQAYIAGVPLYTQGEPCGLCEGKRSKRCLRRRLCDNSVN
ncbi:hypothetical protein KIN20_020705 [Parelaphostrongylus tenuis]|uniref:SCP domain-containing protein n=1 Tax=Parelaphostrongylus tenuis TaxID=148309 RepID=A0AAD5QTS8_PARTN|nr:hypothetical protein KIN20_020705 [Parelaphostrongylus tenuis]